MRGWIIALVVFVALGAGGYYLYTTQYTPSPMSSNTVEDEGPSQENTKPQGEKEMGEQEVVEVTVKGTEYSFSPDTVTVPNGSRVRLTFENAGSIGHNFKVQNLGVSTPVISPGESYTVEFGVPESSTTFESVCSVSGHREAGMVGTLIVE